MKSRAIVAGAIERKIFIIRGQKVMLDSDLADLYEVEIRILVRNVKRNLERFPEDFMMQLTNDEHDSLRSQFGILKKGRGQHRKYAPYVFTEQGVAMLSSVLRSKRAVQVNVEIMRAFVRLSGQARILLLPVASCLTPIPIASDQRSSRVVNPFSSPCSTRWRCAL